MNSIVIGDVTFKSTSSALATTSGVASAATTGIVADVFGVPLSVLLAGFAGAVVALSFLPPLPDKWKSFTAVAVGTLVASYGVQVGAWYFKWPAELNAPAAFFIGLLAHLFLTLVFTKGPSWANKRYGGDT